MARADTVDRLLDLLAQKGVITVEEAEELRKEVVPEESTQAEDGAALNGIHQRRRGAGDPRCEARRRRDHPVANRCAVLVAVALQELALQLGDVHVARTFALARLAREAEVERLEKPASREPVLPEHS